MMSNPSHRLRDGHTRQGAAARSECDHPGVCDLDWTQSFFWLQLLDEFDHPGVCDSDWTSCFFWLQLLDECITIPESVTRIGDHAFLAAAP